MKLLLLLISVVVAAQGRDRTLPPTGSSSVSGVVYLGATGATPARRARVTVQSTTGLATGRTTITDNEGSFEIGELAADRFTLQVTLEGWLPAAFGTSRPGQPGRPIVVEHAAHIGGLTIRMFRGSAISGTVRDTRGRPAPNVWVAASRLSYSYRGEPQLSSTNAITDDRGQYRVWGLRPGTYIVGLNSRDDLSEAGFEQQSGAEAEAIIAAAARGGATSTSPPRPKSTLNYAPMFYPATADISTAGRIELGLDEEREGIDLAIAFVPMATVFGSMDYRGTRRPIRQTIQLQPRSENMSWLRGMTRVQEVAVDDRGQFAFTDVRPGSYRLIAQSTTAQDDSAGPAEKSYAVADVRVDGNDVQVALQMRPALTVRGRSSFEGTASVPILKTGLSIILVPPGTSNLGTGLSALTRDDGTFEIDGVIPGTYSVILLNQGAKYTGWTSSRAMLNGRDAFDGAAEIRADAANELVLEYTDRPSGIRGSLTTTPDRQAGDYFIVLLPADHTLWLAGSRRIRHLRAAQDGTFDVPYLPPGEYLIAALADLDPEDLFKTSFLEALSGSAIRITLKEGQILVQNLKVG